jgi:hypothetical protein
MSLIKNAIFVHLVRGTANPAYLPHTVPAIVNQECFVTPTPAVSSAAVKKRPLTALIFSPSAVKPIMIQPLTET